MANALGSNNMVEGYQMLGFGERSGIELPNEDPGILPGSRLWRNKVRPGESLTPALCAMLSIGQGDASASPLQLACLVSAIANGGRCYQPRLVRRVVHPERGVLRDNIPILKKDLLKEGVKPADLERIRRGMWMAVNKQGGTANRVKLPDVEAAAKTGTAQTVDMGKKSHNAWTVGFAPYDAPRYAVAVVVQNGDAGGKVAGPLVHLILRGLFAADKGARLPLERLDEVPGNTNTIAEIFLPNDALAGLTVEDGGETGEEAADAGEPATPVAPTESTAALPLPTITPEVDAEGSVIPRAVPVREP
jgi:penicillin-binding protein 2